jgi:hypothetical protein
MISRISALMFSSLEAGTAFDTNLGWMTGANRGLSISDTDLGLIKFFYFRPPNDVRRTGSWLLLKMVDIAEKSIAKTGMSDVR